MPLVDHHHAPRRLTVLHVGAQFGQGRSDLDVLLSRLHRQDTAPSLPRPVRTLVDDEKSLPTSGPVISVEGKRFQLRAHASQPWGEGEPHRTLAVFTDGSASTSPGDEDRMGSVICW